MCGNHCNLKLNSKGQFMKKIIFFTALLLLTVLSQCAYYNTFFYAKHYYKKANRETRKNLTGKLSNTEKTNYQKAIEKANRLIVLYPNSKYVDDALLMLGKSHYYRSEYPEARRRLNYLLTRFPNSEYIPEGRLWLAKVDIGQERFESAKKALADLLASKPDRKIQGQANFFLAKIYEQEEDFEKAIVSYKDAYAADVDEIKTDALFAIGADYDSLGAYDLASEYFLKAMKSSSDFDIRTEAQYRYAVSLRKMGGVDEAIRIFETLQADERNNRRIPNYRLQIAEALISKNDIDGAIITFQDITEDFKKEKQSAEAFYSLGKLYEKHKNDYEKAVENYAKVKSRDRQSAFVDSAETRMRDIQRMMALQQVIRMAITGEEGEIVEVVNETETLALQDSSEMTQAYQQDNDLTWQDSTQQAFEQQFQDNNEMIDPNNSWGENNNQDDYEGRNNAYDLDDTMNQNRDENFENNQNFERPEIVENPELKAFKKEELDKNLLLLGELYLLRFSLLDSAANQYKLLIKEFPESRYTPQAHYNLCHVYRELNQREKSDSCYRELIEKYPASPYANDVREIMNLPMRLTQEDSIQQLYQQAEQTLFDQSDPQFAFQKYKEIVEKYPESPLAPKAAYVLGWIAETHFDSLDLAYVLYDSLAARYPESKQARNALKKVRAVKAAHAEKNKKEVTASDSLTPPELIKKPVMHDSLGLDIDTLRNVTETLPKDSAGKDLSLKTVSSVHGTLPEIEPEDGMQTLQRCVTQMASANRFAINGLIQCEVLVDTTGCVIDIKVIQSPNPAAEEFLKQVIKQTVFKRKEEDQRSAQSWYSLIFPIEMGESTRR